MARGRLLSGLLAMAAMIGLAAPAPTMSGPDEPRREPWQRRRKNRTGSGSGRTPPARSMVASKEVERTITRADAEAVIVIGEIGAKGGRASATRRALSKLRALSDRGARQRSRARATQRLGRRIQVDLARVEA